MTINELRELSKAATGPWKAVAVGPEEYWYATGALEIGPKDLATPVVCAEDNPNAPLIVAMRNHFDALLDVAEAAIEVNEAWAIATDAMGDDDIVPIHVWEEWIGHHKVLASALYALARLEAQA